MFCFQSEGKTSNAVGMPSLIFLAGIKAKRQTQGASALDCYVLIQIGT